MPRLAVALFALCALAVASPVLAADQVEGDWLLPDGMSKIRIAPCAAAPDRMCGAISWLKNPADANNKDTNNPNAALRGRTIMGMPVISNFKKAGEGRWNGGKIYDPQSGKTYSSKMSLSGASALKVEGCILGICQPQTWTR